MDLLGTPRGHPEFFSNRAFDSRSFPLPLSGPSTPSVISEWKQSSSGYELVNLRPERSCLRLGSEVIIDHNPAIIGQQIAVAVQVSAHVIVRIENEQADITAAQLLPDGRRRRCIERGTID